MPAGRFAIARTLRVSTVIRSVKSRSHNAAPARPMPSDVRLSDGRPVNSSCPRKKKESTKVSRRMTERGPLGGRGEDAEHSGPDSRRFRCGHGYPERTYHNRKLKSRLK